MLTLEWIGKNKVVNHHQEVPFRVLERQYSFGEQRQHTENNDSENMIIHGDYIYDVNIILGNLLDNALENAIDNSKVSLNIKYTAGMIHISMSNLYDGGIKKEDGHIISKKGDKDNHGYGLNNIKRIVDKYDGSMIEEYENGQFEIAIIIYLE